MNWIISKFRNGSIFWSFLLGTFFFISYGYTNYWSSLQKNVASIVFSWEHRIPFVPWMIVPYMSSDLIFIVCFLILTTRTEVHLLAKRIGFLICFSVICYLLFPLKLSFYRPTEIDSIFKGWFKVLENDLPYNQCPSLHISQGVLFWILLAKTVRAKSIQWKFGKILIHIWFSLVLLSTLTLYQHHFIDVLGGVALVLVSFILFPAKNRISAQWVGRFEAFYYFVAWSFFSGLFFTESSSARIVLGYMTFSFFILALSYTLSRPLGLTKVRGRHRLFSRFFFAPYIFISWLEWRWHALRDLKGSVEVVPGLYFGRRLGSLKELNPALDWNVIDLAPEISEVLFGNENYFYFPILDMTQPDLELQKKILDQIETLLSRKQSVYVHCRLGRARSGWIIFRYLVDRMGMSESEAMGKMTSLRKTHFPQVSEEEMSQTYV